MIDARAATLSGPVEVGEPIPPVDPRGVDLATVAYEQAEWFAHGDARSFSARGEHGTDGRWDVTEADRAPYATRCFVRRPLDPRRRSGLVVLEWLNVTTVEVAPEWAYLDRALIDLGATWVGVSAQALGVVGGDPLLAVDDPRATAHGLPARSPERYGTLAHPGDRYAFDLFDQVGRALRSAAGEVALGAPLRTLLACGQSQSAGFLTTLANVVQPHTATFDGILVHSRGSGAATLDGRPALRADAAGFHIRTDVGVPVLQLLTETDVGRVLGYALARQPAGEHVRAWEVAGTAHADAHLVGGVTGLCEHRINDGPHHVAAKAALAALVRWVDGVDPGDAPPIDTDGTTIRRAGDGIARSGLRLPSVDVPTSVLSGEAPPGSGTLCSLFGSSAPFTGAELVARYGSEAGYRERFGEALAGATAAGHVRPEEGEAYTAEAVAGFRAAGT